MAWLVEGVFWEMSWESTKIVFGASPSRPPGYWGGWPIFLGGALANNFFVLAYLTVLFRRFRLAAAFSTASVLCAIGCLLPGHGPGYFVWCLATVMLAITTLRIVRRLLKAEPLFDGILTSRTRKPKVDHPDP
jgi:hypothetical protein